MWNYWLGGMDNFGADRQAAERVLDVMPSLPLIARAARLFLIDAVHGAAVRSFPPATPMTMPATDTIPSLAPSTAARSPQPVQPPRGATAMRLLGGEDGPRDLITRMRLIDHDKWV